LGEVQTFAANVPPLAVQVKLLVVPPEAVALKVCFPGATVWLAGVMLETVTLVGMTVQVVETVAPPEPVTDKVYVFCEVSAGVVYELPLIADAVISTLPIPADPMTPVPPEKVGIRVAEVL
jgi:hypothetical protein